VMILSWMYGLRFRARKLRFACGQNLWRIKAGFLLKRLKDQCL
jgi:hypothetical protein